MEPMQIPKSKAKFINGFNQRNIIKFIKDTNLKNTFDIFKYFNKNEEKKSK